eukprot:TRINITY_DN94532_c0_g1_i1.p1 TRINITY_DN94532_c0_g1~~TRINITY_DN94532_c0_g1_i1.p1  ORF type:complete len:364 (+),score=38.73 TRINITY_DN94532_c0_g1_i1:75-1166(+)
MSSPMARSRSFSMRRDNSQMPPAGVGCAQGHASSMDAHREKLKCILGNSFSTCDSPSSRHGGTIRTPSSVSSPSSSPKAERWHSRSGSSSFSGSADADVLQALPSRHRPRSSHSVNGLPRVTGSLRQRVGPPGYSGHISGKVVENVHGNTWGEENRRATGGLAARDEQFHSRSAPHLHQKTVAAMSDALDKYGDRPGPGYRVLPRLPGTACHQAGGASESVHGSTFAESSMKGQALRCYNPHPHADGWLRKGEWPAHRTDTYQWRLGQVANAGMLPHFTLAELERANEGSRRLGSTFGMHPPPKSLHMPGDRYVNNGFRKEKMPHRDHSRLPPAGLATHSIVLDDPRWKYHIKWYRDPDVYRV